MHKDIIGELNSKDLNEFKKDFISVIRVYTGIAKEYSSPGKDIDKYIDQFKQITGLFNKKYNNLSMSLSQTTEEFRLRLFIKEKTVGDVFKNVASKLEGLKAIGANSPGKASVEETDKFSKEIANAKDQLYINYYRQETGLSTVFIEQFKDGIIELHYSGDVVSEKLPEFKICAYYAVKDGIGNEEICEILEGIGFFEAPTLGKVRTLLNRFSTRIEE